MHEGIHHSVADLTGRRLKVLVGSSTENFGKSKGLKKGSFALIERRVMTLPLFISEPVAESVNTQPKGRV